MLHWWLRHKRIYMPFILHNTTSQRWGCESAILNVTANFKTQQWPQDWKRSVFIPIPKKGNPKERSNYRTIAVISHTSKVMLKILQARLQHYMSRELPDFQPGFRKGRRTENKVPTLAASSKKQASSKKKTSISALFTMPKPLTVWITISCGNNGFQFNQSH